LIREEVGTEGWFARSQLALEGRDDKQVDVATLRRSDEHLSIVVDGGACSELFVESSQLFLEVRVGVGVAEREVDLLDLGSEELLELNLDLVVSCLCAYIICDHVYIDLNWLFEALPWLVVDAAHGSVEFWRLRLDSSIKKKRFTTAQSMWRLRMVNLTMLRGNPQTEK
jgi:hypothetical protein